MNKLIVLTLLILAAFSLRVSHEGVPGGWNDAQVDPDIDNFIR